MIKANPLGIKPRRREGDYVKDWTALVMAWAIRSSDASEVQ
jgi:hypothetical protein